MEKQIEQVRERISRASRVVAVAGAGLSAESGVPTFRGDGGLWENHRPEELATPWAFDKDPELVWRFYAWRRELVAECQPNAAHHALVELERRVGDGFLQITQNVDGLHRLAGSERVIEIHGCLWQVRCTACGWTDEDRRVPIPIPPRCDECDGLLRPDVVWFGEAMPEQGMQDSLAALAQCEVVLVVGTSGVVQPVASFAGYAKQSGADLVVEINLEATPQSGMVDVALQGKAGEILPRLLPQG